MDELLQLNPQSILVFAFALLCVTLLGALVAWAVLEFSTSGIRPYSPLGVPADKWKFATTTPSPRSGCVIGTLERILFFIAIWINKPEIMAAWLVFKAASKWEAWSNVIQSPGTIQGIDEVDALRARHAWGSRVLTRTLVGVLSNFLLAFLAVFLAKTTLSFLCF